MYPFIWAFNHSSRLLVGIFGLKPATEYELAYSEEELRILLAESYESGEINESEWKYVNNIFEFDERLAKEIMVPRVEMSCISVDDTMQEIAHKLIVCLSLLHPISLLTYCKRMRRGEQRIKHIRC